MCIGTTTVLIAPEWGYTQNRELSSRLEIVAVRRAITADAECAKDALEKT